MLPVEYRVTQLKLNHMFNIVHGSAPEYLKNNINITREPAHNTRSGNDNDNPFIEHKYRLQIRIYI